MREYYSNLSEEEKIKKKKNYASNRNKNMSDKDRETMYEKLLLQKKSFVDILVNHVEELKIVETLPPLIFPKIYFIERG